MLETLSKQKIALMWGNFRNLIDFSTIRLPSDITLVGTHLGEFPVDSYTPIYLEIPKKLKKLDISPRSYSYTLISWSNYRIVNLPNYHYENSDSNSLSEEFSNIVDIWKSTLIPEDIPCIAFAIKECGNYCDEREAQYIKVLIIWPMNFARILELEWFEGPLEDCISPEWYITTSKLMSITEALIELEITPTKLPNWKNPIYSIYSNPSFILNQLTKGELEKIVYRKWQNERNYKSKEELYSDILQVVDLLEKMV